VSDIIDDQIASEMTIDYRLAVRSRNTHNFSDVKKSFPRQRGGIFVESGSRGSTPQWVLYPSVQSPNFFQGCSFLLMQKNIAPRWGAAAATRASTNMPPRWGEEDLFHILFIGGIFNFRPTSNSPCSI
jgi:hypothetical protein